MPTMTPGASGGLFCEGEVLSYAAMHQLIPMDHRPYLHMYMSSNELQEIGVISLTGMNIECDSNKEALFGVC